MKEIITPAESTGKVIDASSTREFRTVTDAKTFFTVASERLRKVSEWHKIAGKLLAKFELADHEGREADRSPVEGDYLKIDFPGPGSVQERGHDWVRIEAIDYNQTEDSDEYTFRVRPTQPPVGKTSETEHFYSPEATITFVIRRSQERVSAEVHDRKATGIADLMTFSEIQWRSLTDGLIGESH
ncbi:MAG TPA: hypothetical protein VK508_18010 [Cyclobacteriaceae bacterium]|nr:hypothetical protein [Cyclobacteriaceae bacterium]